MNRQAVRMIAVGLSGFFIGVFSRQFDNTPNGSAANASSDERSSQQRATSSPGSAITASSSIKPNEEAALVESRADSEQRRQELIVSRIDHMRSRLEPTYKLTFDAYEIPEDARDALFSELAAIYDAKIRSDYYLGRLSLARERYTRSMESHLGERYPGYIDSERRNRATLEYDAIANLHEIPTSETAAVKDLIFESSAYTPNTLTAHGLALNDKIPPVYGRPGILSTKLNQLDSLKRSAGALRGDERFLALAKTTQVAIDEHYSKHITDLEREIDESMDFLKTRYDKTHIPKALKGALEARGYKAP